MPKTLFRCYTIGVVTLMYLTLGVITDGYAQNTPFLPNNLEPITPQNMHSIEQIGMLGTGTIESIAWSPNSQNLAVAGSAGIRLFDVEHLERSPKWFIGHSGKVNDVVFSADGARLISGSDDHTVRQWDINLGTQLSSICLEQGDQKCLNGGITSIALSPSKSYIAIGVSNGITVMNSSLTDVLFTTSEGGFRTKFNDSGSLMATIGFRDGAVNIWHLRASNYELQQKISVPFEIWDFAFSPSGNLIALASFFSPRVPGIQVFDTNTGEHLTEFEGGYSVSIDSTGTLLATLDTLIINEQPETVVTIWNLKTGKRLSSLPIRSSVSQIRFSPDGNSLAVGYMDGAVDIWDVSSSTLIGVVDGRGAAVRSIALLDDQVISLDGLGFDVSTPLGGGTSEGDTLRRWDLASGQEIGTWRGEDLDSGLTTIGTLANIPNTALFILRHENSNYLYLWDISENKLITFDSGTPYLSSMIAFNKNGDQMASFGDTKDFKGQTIYVWKIERDGTKPNISLLNTIPIIVESSGRKLQLITLRPSVSEVFGLTFDGYARVWNTKTGDVLLQEAMPKGYYFGATYSPDDRKLAINSGYIRLLVPNTLEAAKVLRSEDLQTSALLVFNKSSSIAVTGSQSSESITLWDTSDQFEPMILPTDATSIVFSHDDKLLVSGGYDGVIRFWGVKTGL